MSTSRTAPVARLTVGHSLTAIACIAALSLVASTAHADTVVFKPAVKAGGNSCPNKFPGSFLDPRNGGECWSCPNKTRRNLNPVHRGAACTKRKNILKTKPATFRGKPGCSGGAFALGANCWRCPAGFKRTTLALNSNKACEKRVAGPKKPVFALPKAKPNPNVRGLANWMKRIPNNRLITSMTLPGTHDTGANFGCPIPGLGPWALCQTWSVKKQLNRGIRVLDIRLHRTKKGFDIYHGVCSQMKSFDKVLNTITAFLRANPSEVVFMNVQEEHSQDKKGVEPYKTLFARYLARYGRYFHQANLETRARLPRLGALRGKIVLISNDTLGPGGAKLGFSRGSTKHATQQNLYHFYKVKPKWQAVRSHLKTAIATPNDNRMFITFTSANGVKGGAEMFEDFKRGKLAGVPTPRSFSNFVNQRLRKFLWRRTKARYGMVLMDFPEVDIIQRLVQSN